MYKFAYAEVYVGGFVWGTQVFWDEEFILYYFGSFNNRLRFKVLNASSVLFEGPYDEAEVKRREYKLEGEEVQLRPTLS